MSEEEPSEAQLEEERAKDRLRDAEADAAETLERAEKLAERAEDLPPPPE